MGFGARLTFAFRSFFALLFDGRLPPDILAAASGQPVAATTPSAAAPPAVDEGDRAVQLLAILQRDGRLIDFLQEDIAPYTDAQVGAAARDVHEHCRATLARYVDLEPVVSESEGARMQLESDTDPARMKLIGTVTSGATEGVVQHRGWRVTRVALPPLPNGPERRIVAPAEIEVGA